MNFYFQLLYTCSGFVHRIEKAYNLRLIHKCISSKNRLNLLLKIFCQNFIVSNRKNIMFINVFIQNLNNQSIINSIVENFVF